jgi:hypothetical protein
MYIMNFLVVITTLLLLASITEARKKNGRDNCIKISNPSTSYQNNSLIIQRALNKASTKGLASRQLECVSINGGDFPVLSLVISDYTHLRIEPGARLINVINHTRTAIVHVKNANNVLIDGGGIIYGDAERAWKSWSVTDDRMSPYFDDGLPLRANCLLIDSSHNVTVQNIHLHNSTDWTFRMQNSSNIYVDNVDIYGDSRFPNNDGFDPMSCRNVTLVNSRIDVADDGICPKASAGMGNLDGLYVHNVTVRSKSHAIKFGSNTDTNMLNIIFDNITIWDSNGGLSIQMRSEGNLSNITWSNINIQTRYQAPRWWGNGEWLVVTNNPRGDNHNIGSISNMNFINITGKSENGGFMSGISGSGISNITFQNIHMEIDTWGNYSDGSGPPCYADVPVCSNTTGTKNPPEKNVKCAKHPIPTGTQLKHCMGSRDYRPTPCNLPNNLCWYVRTPSKADILFLENVHHIHFDNVVFQFHNNKITGKRNDWYGKCLNVDRYSSNVEGKENIKCINGEKN